jgi:hypothetical protein
MASSLQIITEQVLRLVLSGNTSSDKELKKEDVAIYVNQAFASVLRRRFFESKAEGEEYIDGSYIYSFDNQEVKYDDVKKLYYIDLPATTVDLPGGIGIFYVGYQENQEDAFLPTMSGFFSLFKGLRSAGLSGRVGYYKEGKRLFFINMTDGIPCKVLLKMVAPFGDIGKCNSIDIPFDMQEEIVQMALKLFTFSIQLPKDNINDNIK